MRRMEWRVPGGWGRLGLIGGQEWWRAGCEKRGGVVSGGMWGGAWEYLRGISKAPARRPTGGLSASGRHVIGRVAKAEIPPMRAGEICRVAASSRVMESARALSAAREYLFQTSSAHPRRALTRVGGVQLD